jgi:hypothetical protein
VNKASREDIGLPLKWARVRSWLSFHAKLRIPAKPIEQVILKKCPEIRKLPNYIENPNSEFWKDFPFKPLPSRPTTTVKHGGLRSQAQVSKRQVYLGSNVQRRKMHRQFKKWGKCLSER